MSLRIYFRDSTRRRVGELDDFQSLTVSNKHTDIGSWVLELKANHRLLSLVDQNFGIIVEEDNRQVISGPAINHNFVNQDSDVLELSGSDDKLFLRERQALPCPPNYTNAPQIYSTAAYDTKSGAGETVIKGYVSAAAGPTALTTRQHPGLKIALDQKRGGQVFQQARFDPLNELLPTIALAAGDLGYEVRQGVDGYDYTDLVFDVVVPVNKTSLIKFSRRLGTLGTYSFQLTRPEANYVRVGGGGEETDRLFYEGGDTASIKQWGLIEGPLVDRRDTEDVDQLTQTLYEEIAKGASKMSVEATPLDTQNQRFGVHWNLHDLVTVEINGIAYVGIVREVTESWRADGAKEVTAVIGTPDATAPQVPKFFAAQKRISQRTSYLERRR